MIPERLPDAQAAFDRGLSAEQADDLAEARRWYEYAQRLAPADREITFAIGMVRLHQQDPLAGEPFALLARRDNLREAWLCLVKTRMMTGYTGLAIDELQQVLSHHAPPDEAGVHELCLSVAAANARPGWCGLSGAGVLQLGLRPGLSPAGVRLRLDRQTIRLPPRLRLQGTQLHIPLPAAWRNAIALHVEHEVGQQSTPLVGSPIQIAAIARVEGFVAGHDGVLSGWVLQPADAGLDPEITVRAIDGSATMTLVARGPATPLRPMTRPRGFRLESAQLARFAGALEVLGPDGRHLYGSPLDPGQERRSALAAVAATRRLFPASPADRKRATPPIDLPGLPADITGTKPPGPWRKRPVDVVIPVYRGLAETMACIATVLDTVGRGVRVLVVDDCSPEPALVAALQKLAKAGRIVLHRQDRNRGFPAAANAGMRLAGENDVVLLNSDTLCPPGWLTRLRAAVASAPDIATATPLSNDATILSYPHTDAVNPIPDLAETHRLDRIAAAAGAAAAGGGTVIDIPTGIGFCMYIRRDCLEQVGLLREDVFAQGYGEENDFCIRARHAGWRHVAVPNLFVGHVGGQSFGAAKQHLIERNLWVLNRLHPGYDALVHAWIRRDPLGPARHRMDIARWDAEARAGAILLITHDREGGVRRHVLERAAELRAAGTPCIILTPNRMADGALACHLSDAGEHSYPALRFSLPDQLAELAGLLRRSRPAAIEVHHTIGHHRSIMQLPALLGVPYDVVLHDYSWICPRINLVSVDKRYCGEPALDGCETCYADLGSATGESIGPTALRRRSADELGAARRLLAPSADLARRLQRHLPGLRPIVQPWEDDAALPSEIWLSGRPPDSPVRVLVLGAIGVEKGFDFLLACAREARARSLPLEFVVVGYSCGDPRLIDAGVVITGPYQEGEVAGLIRTQGADLAFLPSLWPETWSYTLSQVWQAGLHPIVFSIGAPADRVRATGRGLVLPLGISPALTNNTLLAAGQKLRTFRPPDVAPAVPEPIAAPPPARKRLRSQPRASSLQTAPAE